ncbi:hypothetical protein AB1Y20_001740 [Prymnesium parvum]|uniref:rRNA-processing protein FYV7 n=1 Tax=Prymnesium parvum TaxID=97485 RepID=A0AB34KEF1_PRYPA|mmetsp:Transcript_19/g.22  ORF Transcript_19/g.22 Transcript_19/m.22 type:complete len:147 (+) Transcript_19:92-532(+)
MVKEHFANPQQRLAIKNRQKKVHRYKVYKEYKRTLSKEDVGTSSCPRPAAPHADPISSDPPPRGEPKPKKSKLGAMEAARRGFESKRRAREEEREAHLRVVQEQQQQRIAARKRRKTECSQHKRRTQRGQPVLSQQLNKLLSSMEK